MFSRFSRSLRHAAAKVDELPLLPQVLTRILSLNMDNNDYFDQLERLAMEDPAFAVRILSVANSAESSPVDSILSIRQALTRMGTTRIRNLAAAMAVQKVFVPTRPSHILLWQHSVCVAVGTQHIAALLPELDIEPEFAYLAGLFHDIGRFVMLEHSTETLDKLDLTCWQTPEELIERDEEIFRYTHSQLGYLACKRWGMPQEIADMVRIHHDDLPETVEPGSVEAAVHCLQIADRLHLAILHHSEMDPNDYAMVIDKKMSAHRKRQKPDSSMRIGAACAGDCRRIRTAFISTGIFHERIAIGQDRLN